MWKEWNEEKNKFVEGRCPRKTWEVSDIFCIFHDPSPEKDVELFKEKLEEQTQSETEKHNFVGYCFPENWDFSGKEFKIDAYFSGAIFHNAYFRKAIFKGNAYFSGAIFHNAYFRKTIFKGNADFDDAAFHNANFNRAIFQDAKFSGTTFQNIYFSRATFKNKLEFASEEIEKLNLNHAEFLFRSNITVDLTKVSFHRAFIENVAFIDCKWPKNYIIYEEKHMKDKDMYLSFDGLETIYRDLKQNMQNHGDYITAGELYYREMEMRRKGAKTKKKRIWLELYRILAGYGEKPQLVIRNSFLIIVLAAVLFFFCGITRVDTDIPPRENPYIDYSIDSLTVNMTTVKDFGYCLYYSVVTFTTLGYGDIHPLGYSHILASAEALTGAFFMALFVVVFARKMMR